MKDLILYCFLGSEKSECQSQFDVNPLLFYVHIGEREEIPIRNYLSPIHSDVKIRIIILPVLGRFDIPGTIINGSSPSQLSSLYYTTPNSYQTEKVTYDVSISNNGRSESCYIAIRACYTSCSACDEEITLSTPTSTVNHNCNDCRNGYIHLEDSKNCYLPDHIGDKIYYDPSTPDDGIFRNCPTGCLTCSIKTSLGTVSCDSCDNDNLYYGKEGDLNGCYNEAQCLNCFLDTSQSPPIWKECLGSPCIKCHRFCKECSIEGTDDDNNCISCISPYYFYVDAGKNPTNCYKKEDAIIWKLMIHFTNAMILALLALINKFLQILIIVLNATQVFTLLIKMMIIAAFLLQLTLITFLIQLKTNTINAMRIAQLVLILELLKSKNALAVNLLIHFMKIKSPLIV